MAGVGTVEACRLVGITRKTGYRWRAESGGLPPARIGRGGAHATGTCRCSSGNGSPTLRGQGLGVREIARRLDRAPSTISRELRRHVRPHDKQVYDADLAHARARENAGAERSGDAGRTTSCRQVVQDKLEQEWSPEQIAAHSCARRTRAALTGTSATRRSTRRCTAGVAG